MDRIMGSALCRDHDDEPRVREILQQAVDAKDVPAYRAFTHESAKKKAIRRRKVSGWSPLWTSHPTQCALSVCSIVTYLC